MLRRTWISRRGDRGEGEGVDVGEGEPARGSGSEGCEMGAWWRGAKTGGWGEGREGRWGRGQTAPRPPRLVQVWGSAVTCVALPEPASPQSRHDHLCTKAPGPGVCVGGKQDSQVGNRDRTGGLGRGGEEDSLWKPRWRASGPSPRTHQRCGNWGEGWGGGRAGFIRTSGHSDSG